jgi:hypothetical protein
MARNQELQAASLAAETRRVADFTAARNAEIELASAAATSRRQYFAQLLSTGSLLETGSLPQACPAPKQPKH